MEADQPMTFRKKLENFWYHYNRHCILGLLLAIALVLLFILGFASISGRPNYDTSVLLCVPGSTVHLESPVVVGLREKLQAYCPDVNGDGQSLLYLDVILSPDENESATLLAFDTRLTSELEACDSQLYLFGTSLYHFLSEADGFEDLQAMFPDLEVPMQYAIPLRDTALGTVSYTLPEEGLPEGVDESDYLAENEAFLDDILLTLRKDNGKQPERRAAQIALLRALLEDRFAAN